MEKTAVLIDGGYFLKRVRSIAPDKCRNAVEVARLVFTWSLAHLKNNHATTQQRELYRLFFYDCPPAAKKLHSPITHKSIDLSKSDEFHFRTELHNELKKKRKVAVRLGHLSDFGEWVFKDQETVKKLLQKKISIDAITDDDIEHRFRQKGVDMRIGADIASLAFKQQVSQIVLFAGDADFVPAAKLARREGIDFILDPMWKPVPDNLQEHIDGLSSTCPKPFSVQ